MLIMFAEQFKKQELEIEALKAIAVKQEESQSDNERRLDGIEAEVERFNYPMGRYYSVMGYVSCDSEALLQADRRSSASGA